MEGITKEIQIGDRLYVSWRDGQKQQGEVIEKRKLKRSSSEIDVYEYYIHFPNFDRRLDEWVTIDRILLDIPITNDDVLDTQLASKQHKKSTSQKRKSSYTYEQTATNTTTTTDPNAITTTATSTTATNELVAVNKEVKDFNLLQTLEKEHEEITKVKNIQSIILGKWVYVLYILLLSFYTIYPLLYVWYMS